MGAAYVFAFVRASGVLCFAFCACLPSCIPAFLPILSASLRAYVRACVRACLFVRLHHTFHRLLEGREVFTRVFSHRVQLPTAARTKDLGLEARSAVDVADCQASTPVL